MNLLVAMLPSDPQSQDVRAFVAAASRSGHQVRMWSDPEGLPPESSTAFDLTVWVGGFASIHNPGGVAVRLGGSGEPGEPITLQSLRTNLNIAGAGSERQPPAPIMAAPATPAADLEDRSGPLSGLPACRYVGLLRDTAGYGEAARHQLWALHKCGLDVRAACVDDTVPLPDPGTGVLELENVVEALIQRAQRPARRRPLLNIYHLPPDRAIQYRSGDGRHICAVVWETSSVPKEWVSQLNTFDGVWVPTEWQRSVFVRGGVHNVHVVPFHLDPRWYRQDGPSFLPGPARREGETVFYSIFQWSERKAPTLLLTAFLTAFTANDQVRLVLKTYPYSGRPDDRERVQELVDEVVASIRYPEGTSPPRIELLVQHLSRRELLALHRGCDVFVSLHRGEGWGMPIHEALLMGRRCIFTNVSAPAELWRRPAGAVDVAVRRVSAMMTPVRNVEHSLFRCDQYWGEPSVLEAQHFMQKAHQERKQGAFELAASCHLVGAWFDEAKFAAAVLEALDG